MQAVKKKRFHKLLISALSLLLLAGLFNLLAPPAAFAAGGDITITGDGLNSPGPVTITQAQLRSESKLPDGTLFDQHTELYSTINTWPTKSWYRGQGVKVSDLLAAAGGLKPEATLIKFTSGDGFTVTFTVQEFVYGQRYRFPHFMDNGIAGHIPGDPAGTVEVEPIIAHRSCYAHNIADVMDDGNMSRGDANLLLYGQLAVTQQTNTLFAKYVTKIEALTNPVPKWGNPTAVPASGEVPMGTMVELHSPFDDLDKVHYTTDGSDPTLNSPMYNWIASRWWSSREDVLNEINRKIGPLNNNALIKAVVMGPGRLNSDVVSFSYRVPDAAPPALTADVTNNAVGREIELAFMDDAAWRGAITGITVNGTSIAGRYTVAAGAITISAGVFTAAGDYAVAVTAAGYPDAVVTQIITATGNGGQQPGGDAALTITGEGVTTPGTFTQSQLEEMQQYQEVYSCINTWPSKKWYVGKGVSLRELLNSAGIKGNARQIRFYSGDGYYMTLTVQELLRDRRYRFPNFKTGGGDGDGYIPGSPAGAVEVEPILGLISAEGTNDPSYMNKMSAPLLMLGQRTVTEQTGPLFVKYVNKIEVLTSEPGQWNQPEAEPEGGTVPAGTMVELHGPFDDLDKVYYTTDGNTPTLDSLIYNWISQRWWSSREADLKTINHPIEITKDTTIKAITIGPGRKNSNVAAFTYKVSGTTSGNASGKITPDEGGTVSLGSEAAIEIPAGALTGAGPTDVKIEKVLEPPAAPAGFRLLGDVYEFSVGGETSYSFARDVTIKLSFDPGAVIAGETPAIHYYDEALEQWVNIGGTVSGNTVTVQVDHFTKFALLVAGELAASGTIAPGEGGAVSLGSEATIEIPAGALTGAGPMDVKIEKIPAPPAAPAGFRLLGGVYEFSVGGETSYSFAREVTIKLGFAPEAVIAGEPPAIHYYDEALEQWVNIGGTVSGNTVAVQVDHFTKFAAMAATKPREQALTDIAGHWAEASINELVALGAVSGYPDGAFKPDSTITRAEFATVLVKAFRLETRGGKVFADTAGHWAETSVAASVYHGIADGYDADTFGPDDPITREQMAALVVKAAKLGPAAGEIRFADSGGVSAWAGKAVAAAVENGILKGYPDNTVRPRDSATRAEAAAVVVNALNKAAE